MRDTQPLEDCTLLEDEDEQLTVNNINFPFTALTLLVGWLVLSHTSAGRAVGRRAFPAAAASSNWNSLPEYVVNASTLQSFQHHLKTFLFRRSFPDILL